jgi:hypothetical protein
MSLDPRTPTFDQLRVFLAVVETGSFAGAARKLRRATWVISTRSPTWGNGSGSRCSTATRRARRCLPKPAARSCRRHGVAHGLHGLRAKAKDLPQWLEAEVHLVLDVMLPAAGSTRGGPSRSAVDFPVSETSSTSSDESRCDASTTLTPCSPRCSRGRTGWPPACHVLAAVGCRRRAMLLTDAPNTDAAFAANDAYRRCAAPTGWAARDCCSSARRCRWAGRSRDGAAVRTGRQHDPRPRRRHGPRSGQAGT